MVFSINILPICTSRSFYLAFLPLWMFTRSGLKTGAPGMADADTQAPQGQGHALHAPTRTSNGRGLNEGLST